MGEDCTPKRENIIQLNEEVIREHLGEMVRSTVEKRKILDTTNKTPFPYPERGVDIPFGVVLLHFVGYA